jgi:hypothetical protein
MRSLRRRYGHAKGKGPGSVQSLLFPRPKFDVASAKAWSLRHGWRSDDVDVKDAWMHLRQEDPKHFARVRTVMIGGSGVEARVGWRKS